MTYSIQNIIDDGCFIQPEKIEKIFKKIRVKKNLILQGPPGTGKSWLAKRLAYALIGEQVTNNVSFIQFHPNLLYGDFIQDLRYENGNLLLVNGIFMRMIKTAISNPKLNYVLVIEEINRGNPSSIFGDVLTLLDADKRTPSDALELARTHQRASGQCVFIPNNLYVIGTQNIDNQSFGLTDLTMRRRFAWFDLEPEFNEIWQKWIETNHNIKTEVVTEIKKRMNMLNSQLGHQFQFGHSFLTPLTDEKIDDAQSWFFDVIADEIAPLLVGYFRRKPLALRRTLDLLNKKF